MAAICRMSFIRCRPYSRCDLLTRGAVAYCARPAQLRNLFVRATRFGEHLGGMLAETRWLACGARARLRQLYRCADAAIVAVLDQHSAMRGMRLPQCLRNGMDG